MKKSFLNANPIYTGVVSMKNYIDFFSSSMIFSQFRNFCVVAVLLSTTFLMGACASKQPPPQPIWEFKPRGIEISYHADNMLNEYKGTSHAIQVVIYQFDSINKFNELAGFREGLIKLLKAENFDPSVKFIQKVFVDPGASGELILDRAENGQWVGIVAGYYDLTPGRVTCTAEIPYEVKKQGFIFKEEVVTISDLKFDIFLGPHDIKKINENE
ncbi:type VI secretion lipoprotein TssJ [Desulfamplus magnetovallimortis]|nr:type VI secretion lipoprotein TssJ [Desulfamplus magnetovallimortis]